MFTLVTSSEVMLGAVMKESRNEYSNGITHTCNLPRSLTHTHTDHTDISQISPPPCTFLLHSTFTSFFAGMIVIFDLGINLTVHWDVNRIF